MAVARTSRRTPKRECGSTGSSSPESGRSSSGQPRQPIPRRPAPRRRPSLHRLPEVTLDLEAFWREVEALLPAGWSTRDVSRPPYAELGSNESTKPSDDSLELFLSELLGQEVVQLSRFRLTPNRLDTLVPGFVFGRRLERDYSNAMLLRLCADLENSFFQVVSLPFRNMNQNVRSGRRAEMSESFVDAGDINCVRGLDLERHDIKVATRNIWVG